MQARTYKKSFANYFLARVLHKKSYKENLQALKIANFVFIKLKKIAFSFLSSPKKIELNKNSKRKLMLVANNAVSVFV